MKKLKVKADLFLLVGICFACHKFLLLLNYMSALILHELAHIFVATKRGYKMKYVCISMFGLSVQLDSEIDNKDVFAINLAGPLLNLILCVFCLACYYIFPNSFGVLNTFCICNLVLSFFNLLPVQPLDGGKIFKSIFKTNKAYLFADKFVRIALAILFALLFVRSLAVNFNSNSMINSFKSINWFYLLFAMFFALSKPKKMPSFALFKDRQKNKYQKIELLKIQPTDNLFNLLKHISNRHYTIFYCAQTTSKYFDEDSIFSYALKYPLDTTINKI